LPGGAAPATGLTDARRRTYAALADSVLTGPSMRLPVADVQPTVDAFARVLRRLATDAAHVGGPHARRPGPAGGASVPTALHSALPTGAERAHVVLLEAAMALVAAVVGQPDGGHDSEVI
jgi:hypothetical protein